MNTAHASIDAPTLMELLHGIGSRLAEQGRSAEIALYGGSALLAFGTRDSAGDADFVTVSGDTGVITAIADAEGRDRGLPDGWMNDAVSAFASPSPDYLPLGEFPGPGSGLKVVTASPRYLLAMKMLSLRSTGQTEDFRDAWNLLDRCGVDDLEEAEACVAEFFPGESLSERNRMVLQDVFEARAEGRGYDPAMGW